MQRKSNPTTRTQWQEHQRGRQSPERKGGHLKDNYRQERQYQNAITEQRSSSYAIGYYPKGTEKGRRKRPDGDEAIRGQLYDADLNMARPKAAQARQRYGEDRYKWQYY